MRIYLVRHAQALSNFKEINFNNDKKEQLTEEGRKQAEKLSKRLSRFNIDKIFISQSRRTYETISPFLRERPTPFKKDKRLDEVNFGIFRGLTLTEAEKKYPEFYKKRQKDKYNIRIPRGESYKDAATRLESFFRDLKKEANRSGNKNFLLVSHAAILKAFLIHFLGHKAGKVDSIHFRNASISIFNYNGRKFKPLTINNSN